MLTIIIGVILAIIIYFIALYFESELLKVLAGIVAIVGLIIPISISSGYEDPVLVNEIELVSLSNSVESEGKGNLCYVSISANNVYSYRYETNENYGIDGNAYKVGTISENVTEIESKDCTTPVLKVYKQKGKTNWFVFSDRDIISYVFYVPNGTISKEVKLN